MKIPIKYGWKGGRRAKQETYIKFLKHFIQKKAKVKDVKIDEKLNVLIWREKPRVIEVNIEVKDETAFVRLPEMKEDAATGKNT